MSKKFYTLFILLLVLPGLMVAQDNLLKKKPLKVDDPSAAHVSRTIENPGYPEAVTVANWVAVDTMSNTYGPAIGALNPVAYDPYSGAVMVTYRGNARTYAVGSGELWYSYSVDDGATWTRSATSWQDGQIGNWARYPSMAIGNSSQSTSTDDILAFASWPDLNQDGSGFGYVGFAADVGLQGSAFAGFDAGPPTYSSQVPSWAHDTMPYLYWESDNQTDASMRLWRTEDFTSIDVIDPPQWSDAALGSGGNQTMGGVSKDGVLYYGVIGTFTNGFVGPGGWGVAYSKSADNGDTWSDFVGIDWTTIPTTSKYTELWDYIKGDAFISYQGDINVDKDGYVHIVTGLTAIDSTVSSEYGDNAIVEFFETASGWDANIILEGDLLADSTFTQHDGPGLGQVGYAAYIAFDPMGEYAAAQWCTLGEPTDSLADVWISFRDVANNGEWSAPQNLTETPLMNENAPHMAPTLKRDGNMVTAFSFYCYEAGNTSVTPIDPLAATVVYIAGVDHDFGTSAVNDDALNFNYSLEQNYPNPFNPATSINYTIPSNEFVSLKVFDVLGNEVATLINGQQQAGTHNVTFDASNLASGVYVYKLTAGSFVSSQKMVLMK